MTTRSISCFSRCCSMCMHWTQALTRSRLMQLFDWLDRRRVAFLRAKAASLLL